jgi:hypothetical protein
MASSADGSLMMVPNILVGAAVLLFGRRLFWLFVAAVGFFAGMAIGRQLMPNAAPEVVMGIGIGVGLIGALVSLLLQKLVLTIAGFLAGGYVLHALANSRGYAEYGWIAFLIGGVLGMVLFFALFKWALILLSTLIGATAIVQSLPLQPVPSAITFLVLCVVGIAVQSGWKSRPKAPEPSS